MPGKVVAFGPFAFDRSRGTLARDGKPLPLGGRAAALLEALLVANGAAVGKDALIEAAWPGTVVEEGNLSVQIAALRKVLGTREDGLEWVATLPRVGYRLAQSGGEVAPALHPMPSLAVLAFDNLSGDPQQEYFADGVVDDIIAALSRYKSFIVLVRKASFAFRGRDTDVREVARTLGADYVLEGSIRRAGERLRISAQLVAASSGATLWARNFDSKVDDVFDVQDEITAGVAAAVEPEIHRAEVARSRRERPNSGAAYDLYLRAMAKLDTLLPDDSRQGVMLLEKVIELDPGFTKAVAMAAWAYEYRLHVGLEPIGHDDNGRCLKLARSALAAAEDDAVVIAHCGVILQLCAHEWEQGLRTIERAIALNPNNVACQFFGGVGHIKGGSLDEAMACFQRAIELNPADSARALAGCGHVHACLGRYEEALDCGTRALAGDRNFAWIHWLVIIANAYLGRGEEAARAMALYRSIFPDAKLSRIRLGQAMRDELRAEVLPKGLLLAGMPED